MTTNAEIRFTARDRTRSAFSSINRNVRATTSALGRVSALGGAVFGTALIAGITRSSKALDDLAKNADRLGLSIGGLQALQLAAEESGVAFGSVTTGVRTFQRSVAQAQSGLATYAREFQILGLSTEELIQLSPEEAFQRTGQALGNLENQYQAAQAAQTLFGRSGVELLNLFRSDDSIQSATDFLREFNLELTRTELAQVEQANDQFARLQRVLSGVGDRLAIASAPFITAISEEIAEASKNTLTFQSALDGSLTALQVVVGIGANAGQIVGGAFSAARASINLVTVTISEVIQQLIQLGNFVTNSLITALTAPFEALVKSARATATALQAISGVDLSGAISRLQSIDDALDFQFQLDTSAIDRFQEGRLASVAEDFRSLGDSFEEGFSSQRTDALFDGIRSRIEDLRTTAATVGPSLTVGVSPDTSAADADRQAEEDRREQQQLRRLRERFRLIQAENQGQLQLELEQERINFEERQAVLDELAAMDAERQSEVNQAKEELEIAHQERLDGIIARSEESILQDKQRRRSEDLAATSQFLGNLVGVTRAGGNRLFAVSKAIEVAQALLAAREAVVEAYKHGNRIGGPPVGAAFAAVAAAASAAQVAQLSSTSIGGAGSVSGGASGGSAAPIPQEIPQQLEEIDATSNQSRTVNLTVQGESFTRENIISIVEGLNEAFDDGIAIDFASTA